MGWSWTASPRPPRERKNHTRALTKRFFLSHFLRDWFRLLDVFSYFLFALVCLLPLFFLVVSSFIYIRKSKAKRCIGDWWCSDFATQCDVCALPESPWGNSQIVILFSIHEDKFNVACHCIASTSPFIAQQQSVGGVHHDCLCSNVWHQMHIRFVLCSENGQHVNVFAYSANGQCVCVPKKRNHTIEFQRRFCNRKKEIRDWTSQWCVWAIAECIAFSQCGIFSVIYYSHPFSACSIQLYESLYIDE